MTRPRRLLLCVVATHLDGRLDALAAALMGTRDATGKRRTECLWMSYPESESFAGIEAAKRNARQPSLGGIL